MRNTTLWQELKTESKGGLKGSVGLDVNTNVSFNRGSENELSADLAALVDCTISR